MPGPFPGQPPYDWILRFRSAASTTAVLLSRVARADTAARRHRSLCLGATASDYTGDAALGFPSGALILVRLLLWGCR